MNDLNGVTAETLEAIKKAAATAGVNTSSGLLGIDLSGLLSLIPVNSPWRDQLARTSPENGAAFAQWRVLLNVNNLQADPSTPFDYAAPLALLQEQDVTAPYGKIGYGYTVTKDAIAQAKGYADAKAIAVMNSLNQFKIGEDKKALMGQRFPLTTPGTPSVTPAGTGGSIGATTAVNVKVAARTGSNYFYGGSTVASVQGTATTGAGTTNSAVATVAAVRGAVAYDWYVGGFYYTTTTVNTVTITSIPVANQAVPALPDIYGVAPTSVPVVDTSAKVNDFNGLLATLAGDYANNGATGLVTPGTGTPSGAYFKSLDGAPLTISGSNITELDAMNQAIFDNLRLSPDALMVASQQGSEISAAILNSGASTTFFQPNIEGRSDAVVGAFVGWYVNKAAGGAPIKIEVHPHLVPGTIIARTDRIPFPNSGITNTCELRVLDEVSDYEYGVSRVPNVSGGGPRFDGECYSNETFINRAPVAMGVLQNVK